MSVDLAERFFAEARLALANGTPLEFPADSILQIAADQAAEVRFRTLAKTINDDDLRWLVEVYLQSLVRAQLRLASKADDNIDLIKWAFGSGATITTATGIALLFLGGATVAPVVAVGFGLGITFMGAAGSRFFRGQMSMAKDAADDIARLIAYLKP